MSSKNRLRILWIYMSNSDATNLGTRLRRHHWFPRQKRLRNERGNSILVTRHYPDRGSASDWSCREGNLFLPIRSTTQFWLVTRHQYGMSAVVLQASTSGGVAKCVGCFLTLKSAGIQWIESKSDTSVSELRRFRLLLNPNLRKGSFVIFGDWILFLSHRNWNIAQFHDWNL